MRHEVDEGMSGRRGMKGIPRMAPKAKRGYERRREKESGQKIEKDLMKSLHFSKIVLLQGFRIHQTAMPRGGIARQSDGCVMRAILYPIANEREALVRQGIKPKDHARENVRRIHEMQQARAESDMARPSTAPEPFKLARFKRATSQVKENLHRSELERPMTAGHAFIRKGDGVQRSCDRRSKDFEQVERMKLKMKPPVPTRENCKPSDANSARKDVDYVKKNALEVIRASGQSPLKQHNMNQSPSDKCVSFSFCMVVEALPQTGMTALGKFQVTS
eukprot:148550-Hanusia_phi.AAC.2